MQEANQKPHNNSYESGGASSSSSSGSLNLFDPATADIFASHKMNSRGLADYLADHQHHNDSAALYNTSAEEGIFPNVTNNSCDVQVPSYVPEFNVNENTPLVYSWFPVVPGFYDESYTNLHNFSHIDGKLDVSDASDVGAEVLKMDAKVEQTKPQVKETIKCVKIELAVATTSTATNDNFHTLENSCNAMDLNLTCTDDLQSQSIVSCDLSFNGKIEKLKESLAEIEVSAEPEVITDEDRKRNESFEMLKKEDSLQMLILNEKSPEARCSDSESAASDSRPEEPEKTTSLQSHTASPAFVPEIPEIPLKSPKTRDRLILARLRTANSRIVPPPSVTDCTTSLTEMLTAYHRNLDKPNEMYEFIETNSLFVPSHSSTVGRDFVEWPAVTAISALDVTYNRNESAEAIEDERLRFCDRYVGRETASSFDFKISQESVKQKLKLLNPSPNSRIKKFGVRRNQFSLASLKTLQSSSHSNRLMIDTKLLSKRPSLPRIGSAKKKTPGKKKTPTSAKRRASLALQQPRLSSATRSSSKRALFTSPASRPSTSRDLPARPTARPLFIYDDKKRRRSPSPSQDAENQCGKQRRVNSPAKLLKSQSFSLLPSTTTSSSLENLRLRDSYQRTQSEVNLAPRVVDSWKPLRYEQAWDAETMSKKVLFNVSTTLKEKNIDKTNENFKRFGTILVHLVKRIFKEYYNPRVRSDSEQLKKFANMMVTQVIRGDDRNEILLATKETLRKKLGGSNLLLNETNRPRSSSLMSLSQQLTFPVLQNTSSHENSLNSSNSSLNRSSSKNNRETIALRENFQHNRSADKTSAAMRFRASESNLVRHNSMPANPSVLKAKRQISF